MCGSSTAVPYASRISRWMASRSNRRSSASNSASVIDATISQPEEREHPVRNLHARLTVRNCHLCERVRVGYHPPLDDPASVVGAVDRRRADGFRVRVLADKGRTHVGPIHSCSELRHSNSSCLDEGTQALDPDCHLLRPTAGSDRQWADYGHQQRVPGPFSRELPIPSLPLPCPR